MSKFIAQTSTHIVTTTPAENAGVDAPTSIRQIMMQAILSGRPKADVKADIEKYHPKSAAAAKFAIHYGWYKSTMKKQGLIAGSVKPTTAPDTIESLEARLAQLKAAQAAAELPAEESEARDAGEGRGHAERLSTRTTLGRNQPVQAP
jgi:hypothetical protein